MAKLTFVATAGFFLLCVSMNLPKAVHGHDATAREMEVIGDSSKARRSDLLKMVSDLNEGIALKAFRTMEGNVARKSIFSEPREISVKYPALAYDVREVHICSEEHDTSFQKYLALGGYSAAIETSFSSSKYFSSISAGYFPDIGFSYGWNMFDKKSKYEIQNKSSRTKHCRAKKMRIYPKINLQVSDENMVLSSSANDALKKLISTPPSKQMIKAAEFLSDFGDTVRFINIMLGGMLVQQVSVKTKEECHESILQELASSRLNAEANASIGSVVKTGTVYDNHHDSHSSSGKTARQIQYESEFSSVSYGPAVLDPVEFQRQLDGNNRTWCIIDWPSPAFKPVWSFLEEGWEHKIDGEKDKVLSLLKTSWMVSAHERIVRSEGRERELQSKYAEETCKNHGLDDLAVNSSIL